MKDWKGFLIGLLFGLVVLSFACQVYLYTEIKTMQRVYWGEFTLLDDSQKKTEKNIRDVMAFIVGREEQVRPVINR